MANRTTRGRARRRAGPRGAVAPLATSLTAALSEACADLAAANIRFALVGGLAVSARAEPRLTRDVDVAVAVADDTEAEQVIRQLVGQRYRVITLIEHTRDGRISTVRLAAPNSPILVDLLFASCGIEEEIVAAAEMLEILVGLRVPVARAGHLIAMKLLASDARKRPQDLDDIRALLVEANPAERRRVTTAIAHIQKRGFARRRDLAAMWQKILAAE